MTTPGIQKIFHNLKYTGYTTMTDLKKRKKKRRHPATHEDMRIIKY